jgi:hypothetical protein
MEIGMAAVPILMVVTRRPQALSTTPMLLAVTPLPRPLTTPPVTSTYFMAVLAASAPRADGFWLCSCGQQGGASELGTRLVWCQGVGAGGGLRRSAELEVFRLEWEGTRG